MYFRIDNYKMLESALKEFESFLIKSGLSDESVFDSKLVVAELVTNVFQHSSGAAHLESDLSAEDVIIKVRSATAFVPPEKSCCSDVLDENGRGLYIIDSISEKRYTSPDGGICVAVKIKYNK